MANLYALVICPFNRFEDFKRYLHISNPTSKVVQNNNDSDDETPEASVGWWYKLEPIASEFTSLCSKYWIPRINVSLD